MKEVYNTIERLEHKFPFFANILSNLEIAEDFTLPSLGTNGASLIVNPDFFLGLSSKRQEFVLLHEATHIALKHPLLELSDWNRMGLNLAADYQVNSLLHKASVEVGETLDAIPGITLFDQRFDGMGFEDIYNTLLREKFFDENSSGLLNIPEEHAEDDNTPSEAEFDQMIVGAAQFAKGRGLLTSTLKPLLKIIN